VLRATRPGWERSTRPSARRRAPSLPPQAPPISKEESALKYAALQVATGRLRRVIATKTGCSYNTTYRCLPIYLIIVLLSNEVGSRYIPWIPRCEFIGNDDVQRRRTAVVSPAGQPRQQRWRRRTKPADNNGHWLSDAAITVSRQGLYVMHRLQDIHRHPSTATTALRHHRCRPEPRHQLLSRSVFQKVNYNNNIIIYDDVDRYCDIIIFTGMAELVSIMFYWEYNIDFPLRIDFYKK